MGPALWGTEPTCAGTKSFSRAQESQCVCVCKPPFSDPTDSGLSRAQGIRGLDPHCLCRV